MNGRRVGVDIPEQSESQSLNPWILQEIIDSDTTCILQWMTGQKPG